MHGVYGLSLEVLVAWLMEWSGRSVYFTYSRCYLIAVDNAHNASLHEKFKSKN